MRARTRRLASTRLDVAVDRPALRVHVIEREEHAPDHPRALLLGERLALLPHHVERRAGVRTVSAEVARVEGAVAAGNILRRRQVPRQHPASFDTELVELGDDALHSVLRFVGPLGLGGLALACKRLLGLVKSLSAEAKGTFDRWALAAACAGMACNSLDRCVRNSGDELFIALCERTGCLRRCSKSQVLRELPTKAKNGHPGDDVIGSWGRANHVETNAITGAGDYLIPTVIGCIGGELLRGVIAVHTHPGSKAVGTAGSFRLLKCSDSFKRLRVLDFGWAHPSDESPREAETVSVIHPHYRLQAPSLRISGPSSLCPLLLASMADPNLPSLAELQTLTQKCYPRHNILPAPQQYLFSPWNLDFARGPTLWPVESVLGLICRAADAQLAKFEQLPLDPKLVNCVQIKPRPLCWLSSKDLQRLHSHDLWRSGDAAGLDQLWDELEDVAALDGFAADELEDELGEAQSLLLQMSSLVRFNHRSMPVRVRVFLIGPCLESTPYGFAVVSATTRTRNVIAIAHIHRVSRMT